MIPLGVLASAHVPAAGGSSSLTFIGHDFIGTDTNIYTFSGTALGTPSAARHIIAAGAARWPSAGDVTSVTIAGVSAAITQISVGTVSTLWFAIAQVPTGTAGDVVVTYGSVKARCALAVWSTESAPTVIDTAHNGRTNDAARSVTLGTVGADYALGVILAVDGDAGTFAWTGATERFDYSNTGEASGWSGADMPTPGSTATMTADWSPLGASAEDLFAISISLA